MRCGSRCGAAEQAWLPSHLVANARACRKKTNVALLASFLDEFASPDFVTEKVQRPDDGDGIDHDIYVYVNLPADWDAFLYAMSTSARRNARAALYDLQAGNFSYKYDFGGLERRVECLRVTTHDRQNLRGKLEPLSLPVVFGRARGLRQDGKSYDAAQACRQILEVDPSHADAARLLKELKAAQQRTPPANITSAAALHQRGQMAEAENAYRAILKADPNHFDAAYLLGVIFLQQREFESAERQIGLAIAQRDKILKNGKDRH
ncbi:tetratricopeptide repeat protein [Bradyrhizobium valentinum]|uniref:Uncharacterized protein n=1 Tax=Bradyrhizobium valentinum TaxID=1518501 RepID=A0A0R3KLU4_9BRAD|nr:tetratricopeptide repeat protein [Bradyrhizobium valentinum]KRQ96664.1 hypothetical protein CQ10_30435 [Bradyrhizobium valentinum]KRR08638.1 hypothetical protein CP49_38370 [Bradyrhizobium valentinum]